MQRLRFHAFDDRLHARHVISERRENRQRCVNLCFIVWYARHCAVLMRPRNYFQEHTYTLWRAYANGSGFLSENTSQDLLALYIDLLVVFYMHTFLPSYVLLCEANVTCGKRCRIFALLRRFLYRLHGSKARTCDYWNPSRVQRKRLPLFQKTSGLSTFAWDAVACGKR